MRISRLFDLKQSVAKEYIEKFTFPHEILAGLKDYVHDLVLKLPAAEYEKREEGVAVHKSASVSNSAVILPPCVICAGAEIRCGAFLRGGVIVGENCVVGNSTEIKNAVLFNGVQVPHYNYIGDSVLGYKAHFGAGSITSNVKSDKSLVCIKGESEKVETGRKKVGAFVGDYAEIGCNSVLCPGTVIGRGAVVYPLTLVRGEVGENVIVKTGGERIKKESR